MHLSPVSGSPCLQTYLYIHRHTCPPCPSFICVFFRLVLYRSDSAWLADSERSCSDFPWTCGARWFFPNLCFLNLSFSLLITISHHRTAKISGVCLPTYAHFSSLKKLNRSLHRTSLVVPAPFSRCRTYCWLLQCGWSRRLRTGSFTLHT